MKKAFDANVSRAKPRMRLGSMLSEAAREAASVSPVQVESIAELVAKEAVAPVIPSVTVPEPADLSSALKSRAQARANKPTAAEAIKGAMETPVVRVESRAAGEVHSRPTPPVQVQAVRPAPRAHVEAPVEVTEVQTAPPPQVEPEVEPAERRTRLKERLKAVRENPRPEPLPDTVAEAGVLAVERISTLQTELAKARAMNLALTQDLEAARRQAERATEEARLRMDEARRLSTEMEGRVALLEELERELAALEGERNESLLALQESRQLIEAGNRERAELKELLVKKDQEIDECLAEEERLAGELEAAQEAAAGLKRSADALKSERDTLARQVSELTRERAELLEARKALEAVHRALSSAVVR
ncbi:MAG: extensin-like protein [Myxococcota bacterium]